MEQRLAEIFAETFHLPTKDVRDALTPGDVRGWDSLGHMRLVSALEEAFGVTFVDDDVMQMASLEAIKSILKRRWPAR
jgi:acyl carrier protein